MKSFLDWSAYKDAGMGDAYADIPKHGGDYAKAIAVCINSGQCETLNKQVMCPSFKVSEEASHSTGGRVRLLKAALSVDNWQEAFTDPQLAEAMELCVSCKGCKRECDNNVDMALIKAEYLAWKGANQGYSRRSRLFADTPKLLHRFAWLGRLLRWRNRSPWLRKLGGQWLGLAPEMPLPEPAPAPLSDERARALVAEWCVEVNPELPEVVLLLDTFARYFEPEIAESAIALLGKAGYRLFIASPIAEDREPERPLCCGRTYLAQGMVAKARAEAGRMAAALTPHILAGRTIVGLEASCVLGLKDDALALGLGESMAIISRQVFLLEEFLAKEIMAKRLNLPLAGNSEVELLIHGHCHQKAVGAMKSVRRLLKQYPEIKFSMVESGCCGMAGTFSLEAEHHEIGIAMAKQALMPALAANQSAQVVANGFSCRQQMRALGDQRPQHLAVYLRSLLAD
ncbi:(Fe-S)-binding protein [Halioxenophilus sp. WMMB6]|uniref:(Fe-S)-binding protein n=1 Tax=Halioxenophilus sp. WMMB6 TaxID=3073815 RepID=UPI00295E73F3|nr:(Fe-S)-binding protein [Halioxenophilus sp. WMMB6]